MTETTTETRPTPPLAEILGELRVACMDRELEEVGAALELAARALRQEPEPRGRSWPAVIARSVIESTCLLVRRVSLPTPRRQCERRVLEAAAEYVRLCRLPMTPAGRSRRLHASGRAWNELVDALDDLEGAIG